ncbi:hypothetical protein QFC21_006148 [Naganishia friedmannii]|uniref:Uncharacterized protein n=1 Tax=Naganishia friedmannii TaxID=89922 RepID=A0ACC2V4W6_9TREE|nr:hypothetical protein QFC21_006148 [Naganishia friedmannii]
MSSTTSEENSNNTPPSSPGTSNPGSRRGSLNSLDGTAKNCLAGSVRDTTQAGQDRELDAETRQRVSSTAMELPILYMKEMTSSKADVENLWTTFGQKYDPIEHEQNRLLSTLGPRYSEASFENRAEDGKDDDPVFGNPIVTRTQEIDTNGSLDGMNGADVALIGQWHEVEEAYARFERCIAENGVRGPDGPEEGKKDLATLEFQKKEFEKRIDIMLAANPHLRSFVVSHGWLESQAQVVEEDQETDGA